MTDEERAARREAKQRRLLLARLLRGVREVITRGFFDRMEEEPYPQAYQDDYPQGDDALDYMHRTSVDFDRLVKKLQTLIREIKQSPGDYSANHIVGRLEDML